MIEIYYTGAEFYQAQQKDPSLSLGGFISGTLVPNDEIGNLFSGLPNQKEYIVLAIKNETGAPIPSLELWFDYPINSESEPINRVKYFVGGKTPVADDCGDLKTEKLASRTSAPYTVQFTEATTDDRFLIENLDMSDFFIIFVKRELIPQSENQEEINLACYEQYKAEESSPTKETIQLVFSF